MWRHGLERLGNSNRASHVWSLPGHDDSLAFFQHFERVVLENSDHDNDDSPSHGGQGIRLRAHRFSPRMKQYN
jgi:hypothetical protein